MGRALIQAVAAQEGATLAAAIERPDSSLIGADAGELAGIGANGIKVVGSLEAVINDIDVLIDFTAPVATIANLALCQQHGKRIVIGTTGLDDAQKAPPDEAAAITVAFNRFPDQRCISAPPCHLSLLATRAGVAAPLHRPLQHDSEATPPALGQRPRDLVRGVLL